MATISERMKAAMELRGIKQADLVSATGIGKSSISTYLSGEYKPKQENVYKIAKVLDVNEAWLMGEDVPMDRFDWDAFSKEAIKSQQQLFSAAEHISDGVVSLPCGIVFKNQPANYDFAVDEMAALLSIYNLSTHGKEKAMYTLRVLSELVSVMSEEDQNKLVAFAEFLEAERQKRLGIHVKHPYQKA